MRHRALITAAAIALLTPGAALAHHSFAMFDSTKEVKLEGVVKEFQWTNPHSWIQLLVTDGAGKTVEWSIEGGSPNGLTRMGWKRTSIKPGDQATVFIRPLRDGAAGGALVRVIVGGQVVGGSRTPAS